MALKAAKVEIWSATLEDRPGGGAEKLEALAKGGANLEFVFMRRTPESPGRGVMFATPVKGARAKKAAQEAGFAPSADIHFVRIEGGDKPGLGSRMARALAGGGISFRALSATALGRKFVTYLALDSAEDAARAVALLRKVA
jgi:hypothetical protein